MQKEVAEGGAWEMVWLKGLASELESEDPGARFVASLSSRMNTNFRTYRSGSTVTQKPLRLTADLSDRLLIARLEIDPQAMSYVRDFQNFHCTEYMQG